MALIGQSTGQNPQGQSQVMPVSGLAFSSTLPLASNGVISTGWMDNSGYVAIQLNVYSDQIGQYVLEFSNDKITNVTSPVTVQYDATFAGILARQGGLAPRANFVRITYTNGPTAQALFQFSVSLLTTNVQVSVETLKDNVADSRLAEVVKNVQQAKDASGVYDFIYRVGNALNVSQYSLTPANKTQSLTANTSTTLLTLTAARKGATIYSLTAPVYVLLGSGASATAYTVLIPIRGYYEVPYGYAGIITAFSTVATSVNITELT